MYCFYFPYLTIGGVSTLFSFIASHLSSQETVIVVDFHNGALASLTKSHSNIITITRKQLPAYSYRYRLVIISQFLPLWRFQFIKYLNPTTSLFFWALHPDNLEILPKYRSLFNTYSLLTRPRLQKLNAQLALCLEHNALVSMDQSTTNGLHSSLKLSLSSTTPIPALPLVHQTSDHIPSSQPTLPTSHRETIVFTWIGRLEDFKTNSLLSFCSSLENLAKSDNLSFHLNIVGTGSDLDHIQSAVENHLTSTTFHGSLSLPEISDLLHQTHIGFGMGLSLLEFASRGIPCFIADFSYSTYLDQYSFPIFSRYRTDLGMPVTKSPDQLYGTSDLSFAESVQFMLNNYISLSLATKKCYDDLYSINTFIPLFSSLASSTLLTAGIVQSSYCAKPDLGTIFLSSIALLANYLKRRSFNSLYGGFSWIL